MCAVTAVSGLLATAIVAMRYVCLSARHGHMASKHGPARIAAMRDFIRDILSPAFLAEVLVLFFTFVGTLALLRTAFP
jgi:hypothetical protein